MYRFIQWNVKELSQKGITPENLPERVYNKFIKRGYKVYEPFFDDSPFEGLPSSLLISGPSVLPYASDINEIRRELDIYIFQSAPLHEVRQVHAMGRRIFTPFNGKWREDDDGISKLNMGPVREGQRRIEQLEQKVEEA